MNSGQDDILAHVLVGIGGSERSFVALRYAGELARAGRGKLEALIVEESVVSAGLALFGGEALRKLIDRGERERRRLVSEIERRIRHTAIEHELRLEITRREGRVADCLVEASYGASVLVMGKRGCHEDRAGLLGSNTELIVRRTHKPVLLTPRDYRPLKGILLAFAGKDADPTVLGTAKSLAEALWLPVEVFTVMHGSDNAKAIQDVAREAFASGEQKIEYTSGHGPVAETIAERSATDKLLVMGAYGHSRLYHMTLGSVTEQVMRTARGPVLLCAKHG